MLRAIKSEYRSRPNDYLQAPTISRTIHPHQISLAERYFDLLKTDEFFVERILPRMQESKSRNPLYLKYRFFPHFCAIGLVRHVNASESGI